MNKGVVFILIFTVNLLTHAQINLNAGAKLGLNITQVKANQSSVADKSKLGALFAGMVAVGIGSSGLLYGVGEITFEQKGGTNAQSGKNSSFYTTIPFLIRYIHKSTPDSPWGIFANVGIYTGYRLHRTNYPPEPRPVNYTPKSRFFEFGLASGLGVLYNLGKITLIGEYRYSFALTNMAPKTIERNRGHNISFGFTLPVIKKNTNEIKEQNM